MPVEPSNDLRINGRYGELALFQNDTGAASESLRTYGEWAENEISFLKQFIRPGSTVLDIGAYIGTHTLAFARFVGPKGCVVAVEAQPETFALLSRNVQANTDLQNVALHNAVALSSLGEVTITTVDTSQRGSFGSASPTGATRESESSDGTQAPVSGTATARALTIDSLKLGECALIKIDVEGLEDQVIRGALGTLARCSPMVYCECNTVAAGMKSFEVLRAAGYRVMAHVVDAFNPDNYKGTNENIFSAAREVALLGYPETREGEVRAVKARPVELLLPVEDADDLTLCMMNKPQYAVEVLRQTQAAAAGGTRILNELDRDKVELERLRGQEQTGVEDAIAALEKLARERAEEVNQLNEYLSHRDQAIKLLQDELAMRVQETATLHSYLRTRDEAIERLQEQLASASSLKTVRRPTTSLK